MKIMPIRSNLHWVAYKEVVASSTIKSLEVFASKVVKAPLFEVYLNQTLVEDVQHKVEVEANEYPKYEFGGSAPINDDDHDFKEEYEKQHIGDVEAQVRHQDMDPDIIYQRACVDDSDDEGPINELDEDGLTQKEAEWYTKINVDISWSHVTATNAVVATNRHTTRGLAKQTKLQKGTILLLVMPVAEVPVVMLFVAEVSVVMLLVAKVPVVMLLVATPKVLPE
ncbi:hypothetical protein D1007_45070 [Hordeum vulgare]|nr:hypothetical protein D1007_45070 [Hordeum vulgare]